MAITRTKKEETILALENAFKNANILVFVQFSQITAEELGALRSTLRENGVMFKVAKKRLMAIVFEKVFKNPLPKLEGEIGLAYGTDKMDSARLIGEQIKKLDKRISIEGGVFDSNLVDAEYMRTIAMIPDLQTLRGQFVGMLMSPIRSMTIALSEIAKAK